MRKQSSLLRKVRRYLNRLTKRQRIIAVVAIVAAIGLAIFYRDIDVAALHRYAEQLSAPAVIALATVLPLLAFPVFPLEIVVGMRFGVAEGMLVVAFAIVVQHLAAFALAKSVPKLFANRFRLLRRRLPHAAHAPVAGFTALLPGMPYFALLYVLPVIEIPLGTYLLVSAPVHIVRATVGVVFGNVSDHLTPARIAGFAIYSIALVSVCSWAYQRVRDRAQPSRRKRKRASASRTARFVRATRRLTLARRPASTSTSSSAR